MKAIVFDMFGVIAKDPDGGLLPFIHAYFPDLTREDVYAPWRKMNEGELDSLVFWRMLGFQNPEAAENAYIDSIEIEKGFFKAADYLSTKYYLALLSNDVAVWSRKLREKHGLNRYFNAIVVSGDHGHKKPERRVFELLFEELGLKGEDCLFVEDRPHNLLAARAQAMHAVMFDRGLGDFDGPRVQSFEGLCAYIDSLGF